MADVFQRNQARALLRGKRIVFMGDSILRSIYQDLISLLHCGELAKEDDLKKKGEQIPTYMTDRLVFETGKLSAGRNYTEVRKFRNSENTQITFFFTTRCYDNDVNGFFKQMDDEDIFPDLLIVLSCIWDLSRWGIKGAEQYQGNVIDLVNSMRDGHEGCQLLWLTCPPISPSIHGPLLLESLDAFQHQLRFHVLEANKAAAIRVAAGGHDVVDLHYECLFQIGKRMDDGIHWTSPGVRFQTNLVLTHIALMFDKPLPGGWSGRTNIGLDDTIRMAKRAGETKRPTDVLPWNIPKNRDDDEDGSGDEKTVDE